MDKPEVSKDLLSTSLSLVVVICFPMIIATTLALPDIINKEQSRQIRELQRKAVECSRDTKIEIINLVTQQRTCLYQEVSYAGKTFPKDATYLQPRN